MSDFIREKIKDKPISKKRVLANIGIAAACGLVFAIVASIVFILAYKLMGPSPDGTTVVSDNDDIQETQIVEDTQQADTEMMLDYELTVEDYQAVQAKLFSIGQNANKSVVTITGTVGGVDIFYNAYETSNQSLGLITSDTGKQLIIVTDRNSIASAESISVTFSNGYVAEAAPVKYDASTGLAVISVDKGLLDDITTNSIAVAPFGKSAGCVIGQTVIAVEPNKEIYTGFITSTSNEVSGVDNNYSVLTTNIVSGKSGEGILVNTKGEVVGMAIEGYDSPDNNGTLTVVAISEIEPVISNLTEGKAIPYAGVHCTTVTDKIANRYNIPKGVYVTAVDMDSPAFAGGLQSGDVIVKIGDENISTVAMYRNNLMKLTPGQKVKLVVKRKSGNGYSDINCTVEIGETN